MKLDIVQSSPLPQTFPINAHHRSYAQRQVQLHFIPCVFVSIEMLYKYVSVPLKSHLISPTSSTTSSTSQSTIFQSKTKNIHRFSRLPSATRRIIRRPYSRGWRCRNNSGKATKLDKKGWYQGRIRCAESLRQGAGRERCEEDGWGVEWGGQYERGIEQWSVRVHLAFLHECIAGSVGSMEVDVDMGE